MADRYIQKIGEVFGDTDMGRVPLTRDMAASWTSFAAGLERLLAPLKGDPR